MKTALELRAERGKLVDQASALVDAAEKEDRGLTDEESTEYDSFIEGAKALRIRYERIEELEAATREAAASQQAPSTFNVNRSPLGHDEYRELREYIVHGDANGLERRASNDTDMNIGTDADGGYAVPTGHHNEIIAKRDESALTQLLGVRQIPGVGTTVNVPVDNSTNGGEFISTAEAVAGDRDAPPLAQVAMTLVKYTKKIELSYELLNDEASRLMPFLADFVGRGMATTHNQLLITEVATGGTNFKTFASATAIAAGEPEDIVGNAALSNYLDDGGSVSWVTRSNTHWDIKSLLGADRQYAEQTAGSGGMTLLGYPMRYSNKVPAMASTTKSIYFGNWNFVGFREAPGFTVLRNPYLLAATGQVVLHYYFRAVYKTLQAEAIGYGTQAA